MRLVWLLGVDPSGECWDNIGGAAVASPDRVGQQECPVATILPTVVITDLLGFGLAEHLVTQLQVDAITAVTMQEPDGATAEADDDRDGE